MNSPIQLNDQIRDAFLELANIGIGRAAAAMSELVGRHIRISVPSIQFSQLDPSSSIPEFHSSATVQVIQEFQQGLEGRALLILSRDGACGISSLMLGEEIDPDTFGATEQAAILELANIMIGGLTGSLCNSLQMSITYAPPELQLISDDHISLGPWHANHPVGVILKASLSLENCDIASYIALVLTEPSFKTLESKIQNVL
ncbi:MAG: chemotaxis protein CheC [Chthoniobacterales bacterium]|nr:chemotaxis protein CheC [Chthoniobacterales bacterium]MCX7713369.1 chemotaxis protein CheC [Chthoniobacterales bacterium]